jgi:DNA-binding NarL/FixJ family response regulator
VKANDQSASSEKSVEVPIRILLVDDNPFFLEAASDFLDLHEHFTVVGAATDGKKALEQAQTIKPDVILLDLHLGTELAFDLIPLFKEKLPQTKIVVITILEGDAYIQRVMQTGGDAFIHKSALTQTLIRTITELNETERKSPNSNN